MQQRDTYYEVSLEAFNIQCYSRLLDARNERLFVDWGRELFQTTSSASETAGKCKTWNQKTKESRTIASDIAISDFET